MKTFVSIITLSFCALVARPSSASAPKLPADVLAMEAVKLAIKQGSDAGINARVKDLEAKKLKRDRHTESAVLGRQCGFAGCDTVFLVTESYSSSSSNMETEVVAVVVTVNDTLQSSRIVKTLDDKQIVELKH